MITISIANQKGGYGKTATCHNLGAVPMGSMRVLMIDTDPQSSLTRACGITDTVGKSLAEVLNGAQTGSIPLSDAIYNL